MRFPKGGYNATYMFANSTRNSNPDKATTKARSKSSDGRACVAPLCAEHCIAIHGDVEELDQDISHLDQAL
jgi:hypothetical protein